MKANTIIKCIISMMISCCAIQPVFADDVDSDTQETTPRDSLLNQEDTSTQMIIHDSEENAIEENNENGKNQDSTENEVVNDSQNPEETENSVSDQYVETDENNEKFLNDENFSAFDDESNEIYFPDKYNDGNDEVSVNVPMGYDSTLINESSEDQIMVLSDNSIRVGDWSYHKYTYNGANDYVIDGYYGNSNEITLPSVLQGHIITAVTFIQNNLPKTVKIVHFPSSITQIFSFAFQFSNVEEITFPSDSQLQSIESYAFRNTPIQSFAMPKKLKTIGESAFENTLLKTIEFNEILEPCYVTNSLYSGNEHYEVVNHYNFAAAAPTGLQYVIPSNCINYKVQDGALLSKDGKILYAQPADLKGERYSVPDSVEIIGKGAMSNNKTIGDINIPNSVTTLEEYCFSTSGIKSLIMPDSIEHVQGSICYECPNLKKVKISNNLTELGEKAGWYDFYLCRELSDLTLGNKLKVIGNACFAGTKITSVYLPDTIEDLNFGAFGDCYSLTEVTGGKGLKNIYNVAFRNDNLTSFPFGDNLKYVSNTAFYNCDFTPEYPSYLIEESDGYYRYDGTIAVKGDQMYTYAFEVLNLVNQEREKAGLGKLSMDKDLLDAAMQRAYETSIAFSHTRPTGQDCFSISKKMYAENIAMGQYTPAQAMNSWMNSAGHKANILGSAYTTIGIGCVKVNGTFYWVQCFGENNAVNVVQQSNKTNEVESFPYYTSALNDLGVKIRIIPVDSAGNLKDNSPQLTISNAQKYKLYSIANMGWSEILTPIENSCVNWVIENASAGYYDKESSLFYPQKAGGFTLTAVLGDVKYDDAMKVSIRGDVLGSMQTFAGATRYDTMRLMIEEAYPTNAYTYDAIICSGTNFPDALAAASLGTRKSVILLTDPDTLSEETRQQLQRLKPQEIRVIGGISAVSESVYTELKKYTANLRRISGETRYETSLKIMDECHENFNDGKTAIIATGTNFADALSISSYSSFSHSPILLSDPVTGLSNEALLKLKEYGYTEVLIVGGVNAVPAMVEKQLRNIAGVTVERLSGETRYDTSVEIVKYAITQGLSIDGIMIATGTNFPDALAAGPVASSYIGSTVLLTDGSNTTVNFLGQYKGQFNHSYVVGGNNAVSEDTSNRLAQAMGVVRK